VIREHLPILPVLLALTGALLVPIVALAGRRAVAGVAIGSAVATALATLAGAAEVAGGGVLRYAVAGWPAPWGIELVLDPLSAFTSAAIAGVAAVALAAAGPGAAVAFGRTTPRFYALALVTVAGLLGITVSGDLFNVFVFLEITAIAGYALIASGTAPSLAAGFRYLVLGSVGASFYLLGVGLLYALTGTLNMTDLATRLPAVSASPLFVGGVAFIVVGLAIKIALFPLHGWLPDAYTHAPPPVATLLPAVATKAPAYALARTLLYVLRPEELPVATALAWAGAAAVVVGGLFALRQTDARRLLAYSSVSQMGYIVLGVGLANGPALTGAYLHVLNHAVMKSSLFMAVGALLLSARGPSLAALAQLPPRPLIGTCMIVAALSMVGVPPAGGFFSKWYLLQGALEAGEPVLVAAILLGSLLAAVYMYRLTEAVWLAPPDTSARRGLREAPPSVLLALLVLAVATIAVGVANTAIVEHLLAPAAAGVGR
jgi:multicomponent Na+:H+ antiporter subunit D